MKTLIPKIVKERILLARRHINRLTVPVSSRNDLLRDIKYATNQSKPFALAKIGSSEQLMIRYNMLESNKKHSTIVTRNLIECFTRNAGLFPSNIKFISDYSSYFTDHTKNLDYVGIFYYPGEKSLIEHLDSNQKYCYKDIQQPDRSVPANNEKCYLQLFRGKKILIINPFGGFLASRADKEIFENTWQNINKKWFYPQSVSFVEYPYGYSEKTHLKYGTVYSLIDDILSNVSKQDFDIALIASGGMSIPLASQIKKMGKIAISLGGSLQVLFGVLGERWLSDANWMKTYVNNHWTRVPEEYKPAEGINCEGGCYW